MPTLPDDFVPVVASYSNGEPGGVIRTEVAGGASRYALAWDRGSQQYGVTLILDPLQFSVWVAFYHHVVKKGAIAFDMPLDSGFGVETHTVNIVPGTYSTTRTEGIATVVAFSVEAENKVYEMSATDAANMLDLYSIYGADSNVLLARLARFATVDTNVLDF
jgi:hypothetical protein